jgi:ABC-type multidrug transport system ATPase subunit
MKISLTNAGKRFNREWIFRNFSFSFQSGTSYAITGPNGSGKSTLLQAIAGSLELSEGSLSYEDKNQQPLDPNLIHEQLAYVAPYLEVIEELNPVELLDFHREFKPLFPGMDAKSALQEVGLLPHAQKQIRYFSSGMKQRIKLAQAFFSDVPVLLLDEPCTNLDADGIALYHRLIGTYTRNRILVISSNDAQESGFCQEQLSILRFK